MSVRFAPSPTGTFHLGNLRTAWISHQWARRLSAPWVVRFEDIDQPRVAAGAQERQLEDMAALGLTPDEILVQSARQDRHRALFLEAVQQGQVYPCICSRKEILDALQGMASAPHGADALYTGHCRPLCEPGQPWTASSKNPTIAWRFRGADPSGTRDFIVARTQALSSRDELADVAASFVPAYHWACAIDDYDGRHALLVRAWDLESATPVQREIQAWISRHEGTSWAPPAVFHCSLVTDNTGHRLEKRTRGVTLSELLSQGLDAREILARFERSFEWTDFAISPGLIFGEARKSVTLREIGFWLV